MIIDMEVRDEFYTEVAERGGWKFNHKGDHEWFLWDDNLKSVGTEDRVGMKRCRLCGISKMFNMDKEKVPRFLRKKRKYEV